MKKPIRICMAFLLAAALVCLPLSVCADGYNLPADKVVSAPAALVVYLAPEAEGDIVCFERNADMQAIPAGLVRLCFGMTAMDLMREKGIDPRATSAAFSAEIDAMVDSDLTTAAMSYGEAWTLYDLLSMSMIQTAADAAYTLVTAIADSPADFVARMNALALEIGCRNTNFVNFTGLDAAAQRTSARDVYKMMRHLMRYYSELQVMMSRSEYTAVPTAGAGYETSLPTTFEMLRESSIAYYKAAKFGKTGYTDAGGYDAVSVCAAENIYYLCVVLGSYVPEPAPPAEGEEVVPAEEEETETEAPHFTDTKTLCRWFFNDFEVRTVISKSQPVGRVPVSCTFGVDEITAVAGWDFVCIVPDNADLSGIRYQLTLTKDPAEAPIEKGQSLGTVDVFMADGTKLGQVSAISPEEVSRSQIAAILDGFVAAITSPWLWLTILIVGAAIAIVVAMIYEKNRARQRARKSDKK